MKKKKKIISKSFKAECDFTKTTAENKSNTAQLCVFDKRLARAWMQYATSARGLVAEIAIKIAAQQQQLTN